MKINVTRIAQLADLTLTEEETKKFESQLEETLKYVEQLNEVDTNNIEPTSNVTGLENIVDEDTPRPSLTQKEALSNTKNEYKGFFKVKGILADE